MRMVKLTLTTLSILPMLVIGATASDRIDTKSEFLQKVAGKKVEMSSSTWLKVSKNGQLGGKIKGLKVTGKWYWKDGYWCRSARVGGIIPVSHECQQLTIAGNKLILQRYKGQGSKHTYRMK